MIMQMMNGICSVRCVGKVNRPLSFSIAKRALAVWMCASSLMVSLHSGGGGGTHFERFSMGKHFRQESCRRRSTMHLHLLVSFQKQPQDTISYVYIKMLVLKSSSSTLPSSRSSLSLDAGKSAHQAAIAVSASAATTLVFSISSARRVSSARLIPCVNPMSSAKDENSMLVNSCTL
jgi:hypothetical protein